MATKYKMFYGQYTAEEAKQLSIEKLGAVVYSGKTREIYVDGKCIASNTTESVKEYVDEQINKILGGKDLEKTLDTIKEIQEELLKDVTYTISKTDGSNVELIEVTRITDTTGSEPEIYYIDGESEGEVVAHEDPETGEITYEEGYSDLVRENVIDVLMEKIEENKENIENIESKKLVANILVSENETNEFVKTEEPEETTDDYGMKTQTYTIGVKYGVFKTGDDVLNPESNAYEDGIATVQSVQDYVDERMVWDEFIQSSEDIENSIENAQPDANGYVNVNPVNTEDNIVFDGE